MGEALRYRCGSCRSECPRSQWGRAAYLGKSGTAPDDDDRQMAAVVQCPVCERLAIIVWERTPVGEIDVTFGVSLNG